MSKITPDKAHGHSTNPIEKKVDVPRNVISAIDSIRTVAKQIIKQLGILLTASWGEMKHEVIAKGKKTKTTKKAKEVSEIELGVVSKTKKTTRE